MNHLDLSSLRRSKRKERRQLAAEVQKEHAHLITQHLLNCSLIQDARIVATYLCQDGEVDLAGVIRQLLDVNKVVAVPKIESRTMSFVRLDESSQLLENALGINEPVCGVTIDRQHLEVVLVPLVAFSDSGTRLGRGGGFYDRYFLNRNGNWLIGVAHEMQREPLLIPQSWDQPLDAVVTEAGWTLCSDAAKDNFQSRSEK